MTDLNQVLDLFQRLDIGRMHFDAKNFDLSMKMFESALDLEPANIPALVNLATMHFNKRQLAAAKYRLSQVFAASPDNPQALGVTAQIAQEERNWGMADSYFQKSITSDPNCVGSLINYAYFLQLMGNYGAASKMYTRIRDIAPMDFNARHWRSMSLMTVAETQAEWDEALSEYEIRHLLVATKADYGKPMFQGELYVCGKTLLLVAEQGVGDAVMFGRYARKFAAYGIKVFILCRPPLVDLMRRIEGVSAVASDVKDLPEFDYWLPMMSSLKVNGYPTVKAHNSPYLSVNYVWGTPIYTRLRVGLAWKGNPEHGNDRYRSMSGYTFCEKLRDLDADFFSLLQTKDNTDKPDYVHECNIGSLTDLADTIASMDLIISVDTAQVHIAGAMGVPVFMASHSNTDWRWRFDGSRGKEWYPSMTVFMNTAPLDWTQTLLNIRNAVQKFIEEHRQAKAVTV